MINISDSILTLNENLQKFFKYKTKLEKRKSFVNIDFLSNLMILNEYYKFYCNYLQILPSYSNLNIINKYEP